MASSACSMKNFTPKILRNYQTWIPIKKVRTPRGRGDKPANGVQVPAHGVVPPFAACSLDERWITPRPLEKITHGSAPPSLPARLPLVRTNRRATRSTREPALTPGASPPSARTTTNRRRRERRAPLTPARLPLGNNESPARPRSRRDFHSMRTNRRPTRTNRRPTRMTLRAPRLKSVVGAWRGRTRRAALPGRTREGPLLSRRGSRTARKEFFFLEHAGELRIIVLIEEESHT